MRKSILKLLVFLGIVKADDLNMRVRSRICKKKSNRPNYPKHITCKGYRHRGCWAVVDGKTLQFKTQLLCAEFLTAISGAVIHRHDVYNALKYTKNNVRCGRKVIAKVYYDEPKSSK